MCLVQNPNVTLIIIEISRYGNTIPLYTVKKSIKPCIRWRCEAQKAFKERFVSVLFAIGIGCCYLNPHRHIECGNDELNVSTHRIY